MNVDGARGARPWVALAICWALAFSIACRLSALSPSDSRSESVTGLLFGESRRALSADFYQEADTFFHRGVGHIEQRAITNDWIQTWRESLSPTVHLHTEGNAVAEILPWLKMATEADPHNVEAFLVMSFWVTTGLNRPDLADQILADARRLNPQDYRIPQEQGCMAIRRGRFDQAQLKLGAALSCWPTPLIAADRQALLDKTEILVLLGFLTEMGGHTPQAIGYFKNALVIFPDRTYIRKRLSLLESGQPPTDSARDQLAVLVRRTAHEAAEDGHEGHAGHEDHMLPKAE